MKEVWFLLKVISLFFLVFNFFLFFFYFKFLNLTEKDRKFIYQTFKIKSTNLYQSYLYSFSDERTTTHFFVGKISNLNNLSSYVVLEVDLKTNYGKTIREKISFLPAQENKFFLELKQSPNIENKPFKVKKIGADELKNFITKNKEIIFYLDVSKQLSLKTNRCLLLHQPFFKLLTQNSFFNFAKYYFLKTITFCQPQIYTVRLYENI